MNDERHEEIQEWVERMEKRLEPVDGVVVPLPNEYIVIVNPYSDTQIGVMKSIDDTHVNMISAEDVYDNIQKNDVDFMEEQTENFECEGILLTVNKYQEEEIMITHPSDEDEFGELKTYSISVHELLQDLQIRKLHQLGMIGDNEEDLIFDEDDIETDDRGNVFVNGPLIIGSDAIYLNS